MIDASGKLVEGTVPTNITGRVKTSESQYIDYIPHPAFEFGTSKKGIWVGKYENSGNTSAITIKPNETSVRDIDVNDMFIASKNIKTTYGLLSDTHMMKNTEWGAVAYLTESKYGINGAEVYINNSSSYITGNAGDGANAGPVSGTPNPYNTIGGVKASTTGNIFGIYDMSGGAWEYVAAYMDNGHTNLTTNANSLISETDAKYRDVYKVTTDEQATNYENLKGIRGDAVYETSTSYSGTTSWHEDASELPLTQQPLFMRGSTYSDMTRAGTTAFDNHTGGTNLNISARTVYVP